MDDEKSFAAQLNDAWMEIREAMANRKQQQKKNTAREKLDKINKENYLHKSTTKDNSGDSKETLCS